MLKRLTLPILGGLFTAVMSAHANAGSSTIGAALTSERMPHDFGETRGTDFELNGSHTFDNHVIIGGSVKYYDTTSTHSSTLNVEATIGYVHAFNDIFSLTGSMGVGEHFQTSGTGNDFPYYVFRLGADIVVTPMITWNAVSLRYRDAFDTDNDYNTPELATGVTFKLDEHNSISTRIARDWKDGDASYTGLELGYKYHF